jgi:hypothetical protein
MDFPFVLFFLDRPVWTTTYGPDFPTRENILAKDIITELHVRR